MIKHFTLLDLLSFLMGAIAVLAFAPFEYSLLAPLCLALLLFFYLKSSPIHAFRRGFLFGLGFFGFGVSWVFISIHVYGNSNIFVSGFITGLLIIALALFPAVAGYLVAHTRRFAWITFPLSWTVLEFIRSYFLSGFPWLLIGYTQTNSPLKGYAPIVGVYGVSLVTTVISVCLLTLFTSLISQPKNTIKKPVFTGLLLMILCMGGYFLNAINWTTIQGQPITTTLIQGNIPQQVKWSSNQIKPTLDLYAKLTAQSKNSQLIIWPEAAVPILFSDATLYLQRLDQFAKKNHLAILFGIPKDEDNEHFYNAAMIVGEGHGIYYKRHLVPFGEYLPLDRWLRGLINFFDIPMSDFIAGDDHQPLLQTHHVFIGAYLCYEMAYSILVMRDLPQANILVTLTDDAWFGHSVASAQHLQIGQMRALEAGRMMLFDTNTGITAVIDAKGQIVKQIPPFKTQTLTYIVSPMVGETPYSKWLHYFLT